MKLRPLMRYLKLNWRRHWKMEIFTILQLLLVALLVTLTVTSNIKFRVFRWMNDYDHLSYIPQMYDVGLFQNLNEEDIVGHAASWRAEESSEMSKPPGEGQPIKSSVEIDRNLASVVRVPLSRGHWFELDAGSQVIVSNALRSRFRLGETYSFTMIRSQNIDDVKTVEAKVVGYLTSENYTVKTSGATGFAFGSMITRENQMMFYSETVTPAVDQTGTTWYSVLVKTPQNGLQGNENFPSLKSSYQDELTRNKESLVLFAYLIAAIAALSIVTVTSNLIVNGDKLKRMRAVTILCGEAKESMLLAEIIKRIGELLIASALAFIITFIVDAFSPGTIMIPTCCWFGILIIFVISTVTVLLETITMRRLQPLNVLRRD